MHAPTAKPRLIGRYLLDREIASGGMAAVHFGRLVGPAGFARPVAIKRLHPQFARDPAFVQMLLDEGRVAARIQHPNVVPTLDVVTQGDEVFIVMEHVPGASLARVIRWTRRKGTPFPVTIGASIVAGMLQGLHAAHEAKDDQGAQLDLVHRDVSPQNTLVGLDGVPRLIDFGIAKATGRLQSTRDGELKGKLAYMAPEQVRGEPVTRRTDVYGAAIILWETLTSQRLFEAENEAHLLAKILSYEAPPPSSIRPEIPPSLDRTVLRGLERDPERRFGSAREMAAHIQACIGVATPMEISEWLERVVGDELREHLAPMSGLEGAQPEVHLSDGREGAADDPPEQAITVAGGGRELPTEHRIGLFLRALDNDYQYLQRDDCLRAARRLGLAMREAVAHNDASLQRRQIEECLREPSPVRPSVFLVNPVDEAALRAVAADVVRAGIGWVSLNRVVDYLDELRLDFPQSILFSVSPDQRQVGRIHGRLLRAILPRGGQVLYLEGPPGTSSARLRRQGTEQEVAGSGMELAIESADWTVEGGARAARRWLERSAAAPDHPITICAQNDGMAVGARAVLVEAGLDARSPERVAAFDRVPSLERLLSISGGAADPPAAPRHPRRPRRAALIALGCDGTPAYGRRLVDEGVLAATVVIPPTAGRAVHEIAIGRGLGGAMPAHVTVSVEPFPIDARPPADDPP